MGIDFRLLKGWKPRRLGGGFAGKKESGQLRFGGRDRPFKKPIALELKEQEERRQKERRNRADERRRRDTSRERNRRKSPLRENGVSLPKEPKKSDSTAKDHTKPGRSSKEGSPAGPNPSSRKRHHSSEKSSERKPEPSPLNNPDAEKDDNKPSLSKRRHVSPKSPSRERNRRRSRERRRTRSNERRRSPPDRRRRNSPKRPKRTSRSPRRPRKRSPRQNDKEPAPVRKQDEGLSPFGGRSRRAKQSSLERQVNYAKQDRDRLPATEPKRYSQPSPHRMNERTRHFAPSPASPRQEPIEQSPGSRQEKSNRRLLDNVDYPANRSRRAISPKREYSKPLPPADPRLKHPAYQDHWPQPSYSEERNGKEFNFSERAPHLGESYPSYANSLVSSQQFSSESLGRGVYDQPPSRDPRLNVTQYAAQFLPQRPVIAHCIYGQIGEYQQATHPEQLDNGLKQLQSGTSSWDLVSRGLAKQPSKDERYLHERTRP